MLVLSRKQNQSIFINGDIRVTVVSIRGNQVRIGIEAPESVAIYRSELCEPAAAIKENSPLAVAGAANRKFASTAILGAGHERTPRSVRR